MRTDCTVRATGFLMLAAHMLFMTANNRVIDSPNITLDRARELDPTISEWAWRKTANFTPWSMTRMQWEPIRRFVAEASVLMGLRTVDGVRRMNSMLAGYVNWVYIHHQPELTFRTVFTQAFIDRYLSDVAQAGWAASYRYGVSRQLSEAGLALAGAELTRLPSAGRKYTGRILSPLEIAKLYSWSQGLSTDLLRRGASAVLALSAGAGLDAKEVEAAQVEDIRIDRDLLLVDVRGRAPRTVPVLCGWRKSLLFAIEGRSTGPVFRGYRLEEYEPRFITNFFTDNPAPIRPSARDLRRGWIITQIEAGIPVDVLLTISGLRDAQALDTYLHFATRADPAGFFARIAGAGAR